MSWIANLLKNSPDELASLYLDVYLQADGVWAAKIRCGHSQAPVVPGARVDAVEALATGATCAEAVQNLEAICAGKFPISPKP